MTAPDRAAPPRRVLITGAGSGFGAAMARAFAAGGSQVMVTDVQPARAAEVAAGLVASGATAIHQELDVTRDDHWQATHARVMAEWGGIDVLVNNAGVAASGSCEETSLADWQWVIDIDLMGVVRGCHRFVPVLRAQAAAGRTTHIVNVASFAGLSGMAGITAYGVAKAGVVALSEHLRTELAEAGVGVSVLCPAFVSTNLMEGFRAADPGHHDLVKRWMANSGISADDIAAAVLEAIRRRTFLVLTHPETRWAWRLKRWWPERYYRLLSRQTRLLRRKPA